MVNILDEYEPMYLQIGTCYLYPLWIFKILLFLESRESVLSLSDYDQIHGLQLPIVKWLDGTRSKKVDMKT